MPIAPPSTRPSSRVEPIHLTDDDLDDLASFTGLTRDQCLERVRGYSLSELAEAWHQAGPGTPDSILEFYRSTDLYIWELMQWHASALRYPYWDALVYLTKHYPSQAGWRRVYDFGCGIGTDALFLASQGYDVTLVDVDSPTFRFARQRFERRGLHATFIESRSPLPEPDGTYDVVVCFDVLEHLPDPVQAAKRLVGVLRNQGLLLQQGSFADPGDHPCHLAQGVERFGGLKWHIQLAALGLRSLAGMVYRKASTFERLLQWGRYGLWRATGLWLVRVRD